MHLAGDPYGIDPRIRPSGQHVADRRAARVPPRFGILLGPPWLRRLERERSGGRGGDLSIRTDQNRFHTARSDVETEKQSPPYRTPSSSSMVSWSSRSCA